MNVQQLQTSLNDVFMLGSDWLSSLLLTASTAAKGTLLVHLVSIGTYHR